VFARGDTLTINQVSGKGGNHERLLWAALRACSLLSRSRQSYERMCALGGSLDVAAAVDALLHAEGISSKQCYSCVLVRVCPPR
jgi:hypothetical protein